MVHSGPRRASRLGVTVGPYPFYMPTVTLGLFGLGLVLLLLLHAWAMRSPWLRVRLLAGYLGILLLLGGLLVAVAVLFPTSPSTRPTLPCACMSGRRSPSPSPSCSGQPPGWLAAWCSACRTRSCRRRFPWSSLSTEGPLRLQGRHVRAHPDVDRAAGADPLPGSAAAAGVARRAGAAVQMALPGVHRPPGAGVGGPVPRGSLRPTDGDPDHARQAVLHRAAADLSAIVIAIAGARWLGVHYITYLFDAPGGNWTVPVLHLLRLRGRMVLRLLVRDPACRAASSALLTDKKGVAIRKSTMPSWATRRSVGSGTADRTIALHGAGRLMVKGMYEARLRHAIPASARPERRWADGADLPDPVGDAGGVPHATGGHAGRVAGPPLPRLPRSATCSVLSSSIPGVTTTADACLHRGVRFCSARAPGPARRPNSTSSATAASTTTSTCRLQPLLLGDGRALVVAGANDACPLLDDGQFTDRRRRVGRGHARGDLHGLGAAQPGGAGAHLQRGARQRRLGRQRGARLLRVEAGPAADPGHDDAGEGGLGRFRRRPWRVLHPGGA